MQVVKLSLVLEVENARALVSARRVCEVEVNVDDPWKEGEENEAFLVGAVNEVSLVEVVSVAFVENDLVIGVEWQRSVVQHDDLPRSLQIDHASILAPRRSPQL